MANVAYNVRSALTGVVNLATVAEQTSGIIAVCDRHPLRRSRFDGILTQVKVHTIADAAGDDLATAYVRVWRDSDQVALAPNFQRGIGSAVGLPSVFTASTGTGDAGSAWLTLSTPLAIRAGDAISLHWVTDANHRSIVMEGTPTDSGAYTAYSLVTDKTSDGDWQHVNGGSRVDFRARGSALKLVTYGDSIGCGYAPTADGVFWNSALHADFYGTGYRNVNLNLAARLADSLGLVGSGCLGYPGWRAADLVANFAASLAPYIDSECLILTNVGINNIGYTTYSAFEASMDALLALIPVGCKLIRVGITRFPPDSNDVANNTEIDTWNADQETWCTNNGVQFISMEEYNDAIVSETSLVSSDRTHPSRVGYELILGIIAKALAYDTGYAAGQAAGGGGGIGLGLD
jgi:lysophospholipase L1-like esterase